MNTARNINSNNAIKKESSMTGQFGKEDFSNLKLLQQKVEQRYAIGEFDKVGKINNHNSLENPNLLMHGFQRLTIMRSLFN